MYSCCSVRYLCVGVCVCVYIHFCEFSVCFGVGVGGCTVMFCELSVY